MRAPKRAFRGIWFPREIWLAKDLSFLARGLLVEIDSLSEDPRGCFASNKYLAKFFGASQSQISRTIADLTERGLITVETVYDPAALGGAKRFLRRTDLALQQRPLPTREEAEAPDDDGEDDLEEEQAAPLRKMRRPPTHNAEGPAAKCGDTLRKMRTIDHESRVLARINNNNSASRDSCVLPDAVVVDPPPSAPEPDPTPDPDALKRLMDEHLYNAQLAAQLAAGWTGEEMAAWIDLGRQKAKDLGDYLRAVLSKKDNPPPLALRRKREREAKEAIRAEQRTAALKRREQAEAADPQAEEEFARGQSFLESHKRRRKRHEEDDDDEERLSIRATIDAELWSISVSPES